MGLFDGLTSMASKEALKTIDSYRRRRGASSYDVIQALKMLASANRLFRRTDSYLDYNKIENFYWEVNGHLENITGDSDALPNSSDCCNSYEKVRSSECTTDIDCSIF